MSDRCFSAFCWHWFWSRGHEQSRRVDWDRGFWRPVKCMRSSRDARMMMACCVGRPLCNLLCYLLSVAIICFPPLAYLQILHAFLNLWEWGVGCFLFVCFLNGFFSMIITLAVRFPSPIKLAAVVTMLEWPPWHRLRTLAPTSSPPTHFHFRVTCMCCCFYCTSTDRFLYWEDDSFSCIFFCLFLGGSFIFLKVVYIVYGYYIKTFFL